MTKRSMILGGLWLIIGGCDADGSGVSITLRGVTEGTPISCVCQGDRCTVEVGPHSVATNSSVSVNGLSVLRDGECSVESAYTPPEHDETGG